ncbi:MAG: lytic transglycosylase domain-containing protein [Myxococcaceae bacterium]|nr:lytic transglycosylase domain-containing protein [Myxococcaceae bacterium]
MRWVLTLPLKLFWKLSFGKKLVVLTCAPLLAINGAVAFFGSSVVFPLSPFFLSEKVEALETYARHRPGCVLTGHGDLEALAAKAERRHGLPRGLLWAVVQTESNAKAHRISFAGAMGPAQLMPGTASLLGVVDPFDPHEALDAGARYLKAQLDRFHDVRLAVAAYNAGPGAVRGAVPHNGETEHYVARVMRHYSATR